MTLTRWQAGFLVNAGCLLAGAACLVTGMVMGLFPLTVVGVSLLGGLGLIVLRRQVLKTGFFSEAMRFDDDTDDDTNEDDPLPATHRWYSNTP